VSERRQYDLVFYPAALRSLRKLPRDVNQRIQKDVEALRDNPRPHGAKAPAGSSGWLRIRIGDYRVIYEVRDTELVIVIIQAGHRSVIYRSR
jgi:mRNA interferase RelE/StbE